MQTWRAAIAGAGVVSYAEDGKRKRAPHAKDYVMRELPSGDYEFTRPRGPTFVLPLNDVSQYKKNGTLKFPDEDWP